MKHVFLYLSILLFGCSHNNAPSYINFKNDTLITNNNYRLVFNKTGQLMSILKDSLNFKLEDNNAVLEFNGKEKKSAYYINMFNGLYKSKYYVKLSDVKNFRQNQVIYFDTSSVNFSIKERSNLFVFKNLPDTAKKGQLIVNLNLNDSIYPFFNYYRIHPDSNFRSGLHNILKSEKFHYMKGVTDTISLNKKGIFRFKGFVENYFIDSKGNINAITYYFEKPIFVK